jgi:TRAP-type C4-dicarboxylate transport system permease small subunit
LMLSERGKRALESFAALASLAFCILVLWSSLDWWWEAWKFGFRTSSMWRAPLWVPYLSVPLGMGLLALQLLADLVALATDKPSPGDPGPAI